MEKYFMVAVFIYDGGERPIGMADTLEEAKTMSDNWEGTREVSHVLVYRLNMTTNEVTDLTMDLMWR